jgi:uncharacterized protein YcgL (UPF0745 family)
MNRVKLALTMLLLLGCASNTAKQQEAAPAPAPPWIQDEWRSSRYPSAEWHTGFARDRANGSPGKAEYEAVEKDAQNKLSESIVVQVQSVSTLENTSQQTKIGQNISETISRDYIKRITSTSNAVLAKMETHSHFDPQSGYIYAFAAVKKKDLASFYKSSINSLFAFAEKEFAIAEQLEEQGKKKMALDKIRAVDDSLKNVSYWGFLLQMVESDNSYMAKEKDLIQKAGSMKMQLQNATSVYLDISGDGDLSRLGAQMQEKGCNCNVTEEKEKAEYLVAVKTTLSRCSGESSAVFCYANATVTVHNLKSQKTVNVSIPEAKGGWVKGDKEKAAEEAFKKLTSSLAEKINQTINQ